MEVIDVPLGGDIGAAVANAGWSTPAVQGEMKAIFVLDPGSTVQNCLPTLKSAQTLAGFVQCMYDGSDYQYYMVTLYPWTSTPRDLSKEYGRIYVESNGDVIDSEEFPYSDSPIPGYTKMNSSIIDCGLIGGSTTMVSLSKAIPANACCFIEADVVTSVVGGTVKTSSALMFFRYTSGATMCDINSKAFAGTNVSAQIKLNISQINSSTAFLTVTTAYNLDSSVSGGVLRIKSIYAKV